MDFRIESNNVQPMFFVDAGNDRVGIGTDSPSTRLHIRNGTATNIAGYRDGNTSLIVEGDTSSYIQMVADNDAPMGLLFDGGSSTSDTARGGFLYDRNDSNASLRLKAGGLSRMGVAEDGNIIFMGDGSNEKMRIHTNGNISSNITPNYAGLYIMRHLQSYNAILLKNGTNNTGGLFINFTKYDGVGIGSISHSGSGSTVAFNTSSDYRLKENINYTFDATTKLKQLKPAEFNFKTNTDLTVEGFIAHEIQEVLPDVVSGVKDETRDIGTLTDEDGNEVGTNAPEAVKTESQTWTKTGTEEVYQGVDLGKVVPLLVKTIQELEARITALENA